MHARCRSGRRLTCRPGLGRASVGSSALRPEFGDDDHVELLLGLLHGVYLPLFFNVGRDSRACSSATANATSTAIAIATVTTNATSNCRRPKREERAERRGQEPPKWQQRQLSDASAAAAAATLAMPAPRELSAAWRRAECAGRLRPQPCVGKPREHYIFRLKARVGPSHCNPHVSWECGRGRVRRGSAAWFRVLFPYGPHPLR